MFFHPGRHGEDIWVENYIFGRKPDLVHQNVVCPFADRRLAFEGVGLALLVERHHHDRSAIAADRPRVITENFDESTITGTRAMSGSSAMRLRNVVMACSESSSPSSILTSITCAPFSTCSRAIDNAVT